MPKYSFGKSGADNPETKQTTNFHVTGFLDAPLVGALWVQPGLSLQGKGGKFFETNNLEIEQNTMWIEVPVNFVGKIPLSPGGANIFLGAGPYAGFAITGENKAKTSGTSGSTTVKSDVKFGKNADDDLKRTDLGLNFIGGTQLGNGLSVGAGYGMGLTDLRPTGKGDDGQINNRVWSFSLGYSF